MEQINKLINDRLILEKNSNTLNENNNSMMNSFNTNIIKTPISSHSNKFNSIPYYKYSDFFPNSNLNLPSKNVNNPYRRQLLMAKIIISELQDNNSNILLEKQQIENQLNEALNSIKSLHDDYISLTEKFSLVNNNLNNMNINNNNDEAKEELVLSLKNKLSEIENSNKELNLENKDLLEKIKTAEELKKIEDEKYNYKIILLNKKIEMLEYELKSSKEKVDVNILEEEIQKLKKENISLKEDNFELNNKYTEEKKRLILDIEKYKSKINLLESQNVNVTSELKEKSILLEKELRLNEQYNTLDKHFNNSLQQKNISYNNLNEQYVKLVKEFNEYKEKNESEKEKNKVKWDELNNELNEVNNLNEKYQKKIMTLKNQINELSEEKNNYINDMDINYKASTNQTKRNTINQNYENDIKSIKSEKGNINHNTNLSEDIYFLEKQKEYILSLLLKITPNKKLIQEIIDLNMEILQMERQKENIVKKIKENPNFKNILPKIDEQINNFKEQLQTLEDELISVDFGSSRILDNSA